MVVPRQHCRPQPAERVAERPPPGPGADAQHDAAGGDASCWGRQRRVAPSWWTEAVAELPVRLRLSPRLHVARQPPDGDDDGPNGVRHAEWRDGNERTALHRDVLSVKIAMIQTADEDHHDTDGHGTHMSRFAPHATIYVRKIARPMSLKTPTLIAEPKSDTYAGTSGTTGAEETDVRLEMIRKFKLAFEAQK